MRSRRARHRQYVYGFKLKQQDLTRFQQTDPVAFVEWLAAEDFRIIHLRRENLVLQALSLIRARGTGEYHRGRDDEHRARLHVPCDELLQACENQRLLLEAEADVLGDLERLEISYEDDLEEPTSWQATCDRIFDYLGLERVEVNSDLARTRPAIYSAEIENREEVRAALTGAGLDRYIRSSDI